MTTAVWLTVTLLTPPESQETLVAFYRRTRPAARWLAPDRRACARRAPSTGMLANLVDWICGCVLIYGVLFGVGKLLLGETGLGVAMLAVGVVAGAVIYYDLSRRGWSAVVD